MVRTTCLFRLNFDALLRPLNRNSPSPRLSLVSSRDPRLVTLRTFTRDPQKMRELNPLYNQIKDLKARLDGLRGYL